MFKKLETPIPFLNRFLTNDQKIFQVTGDMNSTVPVHILIDRHEVIVMTAQILVNLLKYVLALISRLSCCVYVPNGMLVDK